MKTCPYCAEEIQDSAVICRYCKMDVTEPVRLSPSATQPARCRLQDRVDERFSYIEATWP